MNRKTKNYPIFLFELVALIVSMLLLSSCEEEEKTEIILNPKSEVTIQYQILNTNDSSIYKVNSSEVFSRNSAWLLYADAQVWLKKEVSLLLNVGNNEEMKINIQFRSRDRESDLDLLELSDEEEHYWERSWDYKSTDEEIERFYKKENISIDFNNSFVLEPQMLEIENIQKVWVDGEEKTYVEIRFSGEAFGFYDGYKKFKGFCVKDGFFAGIIE